MNVLPPNRLNPSQPDVPASLPEGAQVNTLKTMPTKTGAKFALVAMNRMLVPVYIGTDAAGNSVPVDNRGIYRDAAAFIGWVQ